MARRDRAPRYRGDDEGTGAVDDGANTLDCSSKNCGALHVGDGGELETCIVVMKVNTPLALDFVAHSEADLRTLVSGVVARSSMLAVWLWGSCSS